MDSVERHDQKLKLKTVLDERFEIRSVLTESSTATLYHGHHLLLDKNVIIKVLHDQCKEGASFQRFHREVNALSTLSHANIVTAYATGIYENHPYLVTEEMNGLSLSDLFALAAQDTNPSENTLDLETKRSIICQVCDALIHLHSHGIVHRDLRPENILISSDRQYVKLTDFEFAKFASNKNELRVTQTGEMIGSASYTSPEQLSGGSVDARSDLFSLGCLIYELFTGEPPVKDGIPFAVSPENNPATNLKLGGTLQKCINRLLQKQAEMRYTSAAEVKTIIAQSKLKGTEKSAISKQLVALIAGGSFILLASLTMLKSYTEQKTGQKTEKITKAPLKSALGPEQRFPQTLMDATDAANELDVEKTHMLTADILKVMPTLSPTEDRLQKLRRFVEKLKDKQFYDLTQQASESAAAFALRGGRKDEWAFYKLSEAEGIQATEQFEKSIQYFHNFLNSDYAKKYPHQLSVLYAKRDLASVLEYQLLENQNLSKHSERKNELDKVIFDLRTTPPHPNEQVPLLIKSADNSFRDYLAKRKPGLNYRNMESCVQTYATQLSNSHDIKKTKLQLQKVWRDPIRRGYLMNLGRLFEAMDSVNHGDIRVADELARLCLSYFATCPYSKTISHELGNLAEAYLVKKEHAKARAVIDKRLVFEETNTIKNSEHGILDCLLAKGLSFAKEDQYREAEKQYRQALSTTFAKKRPVDKHTLRVQYSLAETLWKEGAPKSRAEAISLLHAIESKRSLVEEDAETKEFSTDSLTIINDANRLLKEYEKQSGENSKSQK